MRRRSFLRLLGAGVVTRPETLTTLAGDAPPLAAGVGVAVPMPADTTAYIRMSDYLRLMGKLPSHIERDVRERSKYVHHLDPDIAVLRSFSLNAKIAWQRERNYDREIERYRNMGWYESAQTAFAKTAGFKWQW